MSDDALEQHHEDVTEETETTEEESEQESLDELRARLEETKSELEKARSHISKLNSESAERRQKLKSEKAEKQELGETVSQLHERLERTEKAGAVDRALAENQAIPELLRDKIENMAEMKNGQAYIGDTPVSEYVADMRNNPKYAPAFKGLGISGGGTVGSDGAKGRTTAQLSKPRSEMSLKEKENFLREHGVEEYNKLPLYKGS